MLPMQGGSYGSWFHIPFWRLRKDVCGFVPGKSAMSGTEGGGFSVTIKFGGVALVGLTGAPSPSPHDAPEWQSGNENTACKEASCVGVTPVA